MSGGDFAEPATGTVASFKGRARTCGVVAIVALGGKGCSGEQSALAPEGRSAQLIADLWWGMLAVGALVLIVVVALLLIGLWRSRRQAERPLTSRGAWLLVLTGGVAAPLVVIVAMVVVGVSVGREIAASPDGGPIVEVHGRLWWWELRYIDEDGDLIATTANEMHIPVGRPVRLRLQSDNVIHSFWVPQLQGKTDLIPGRVNESWVEADAPGVFRGQCAEFCGVQHAYMGFMVVAQPPDDYEEWLASQALPAENVSDPLLERGRDVFLEAGCGGCHAVRGTPAAGDVGPDLTHLASRRTLAAATVPNTRGHLAGWITDPQHVKPGNKMPSVVVEPDDLQALLGYLGSLR